MNTEPRFEVIEGQRTQIVERPTVLQPSLDKLLGALSHVTYRADVRPRGASILCERDRTHRFERLREGRHVGLDGVVRDLRIEMCGDCGATCVRDITADRLPGLPTGRQSPRRRDLVLGWYTGSRRNQRTYS